MLNSPQISRQTGTSMQYYYLKKNKKRKRATVTHTNESQMHDAKGKNQTQKAHIE